MTLPLIYTLQNASWTEKRRSINIVRRHNENRKKVDELIDFVKQTGGIEYAKEVMYRYYNEAKEILLNFPDSTYRQSLLELVEFTIERKK
jgi:octaprenyl-diphosphate synthase